MHDHGVLRARLLRPGVASPLSILTPSVGLSIWGSALQPVGLPISIEPLLPHLPAWLLVLFRLTGLFIVAPVFASASIPVRVKALLAFVLSLCVYPMLLEPGALRIESAAEIHRIITHGLSFWSMSLVILSEMMVGFVIGFGAMLPIFGVQIGARVIDQQMGLGLAEVFNPELNANSGVLDQIYFVLAIMLFLLMGGHRVLMEVLVGTFATIPLGGFHAPVDGNLLDRVVGLCASMFDLAIRVAGPLLCLVFLETVAMGFVARTVPQMNILSIGFPLRIIAGGALLVASLRVEADVYMEFMARALRDIGRYMGV